MTQTVRTNVVIVGAGRAGMLLAHLLAADGVESVVVEARSQKYVAARIRAGTLEHSTVELLPQASLGDPASAEKPVT
jgi:p-hydroxybenzoate 3-monooxygenase